MPTKACFLDRDGVLNVEKDYLFEPNLVELVPGAAEALILLANAGFKLLVISNQGGVGKGLYSTIDVDKVNQKLQQLLKAQGAAFDRIYYCPHHPDYSEPCECRKPDIGLLRQAQRDYGLDFSQCFFVGDRITDIQAGQKAGCKDSILVKSGFGSETIKLHDTWNITIADDLLDAVKNYILQN